VRGGGGGGGGRRVGKPRKRYEALESLATDHGRGSLLWFVAIDMFALVGVCAVWPWWGCRLEAPRLLFGHGLLWRWWVDGMYVRCRCARVRLAYRFAVCSVQCVQHGV